jgi:hypothetical protein
MGNWRPSTKEPPREEWSSEAGAKVLIERLQFSPERAASIALPRARRSGRGGGNSWLLRRGSKSTGAENRNRRLRRALHRIDLGRLNRHLSGETFQIHFFGPRCPEPPTAANQQSAVERMKAIAALAMLMRRAKAPPAATSPFTISLALWFGSTSPNTTCRPPRHGREAISEKCVPALDFAWLVTMNFLWPETLCRLNRSTQHRR